jgi:asparagine synthetase B (glutamine-hydrolysing)
MALYFASRGRGQLGGTQSVELYTSHARVLLSGLGADELLGGYGRHRTAYKAGGWRAVIEEVLLCRILGTTRMIVDNSILVAAGTAPHTDSKLRPRRPYHFITW